METKQEAKSLPRNRKCGNCRYFEPAPLWRKGWCRNPRLYDRRANHLVDAATIDCEQVFRARIYWEPVPAPDRSFEVEPAVINGYQDKRGQESFIEPGSADAGRGRNDTDGVLRSTNRPFTQRPAIRREKATATPGLVARPSSFRKWLVENIPYYDRIDGPISRINFLLVLPWLLGFVLLLVVFLNISGKKDPKVTSDGATGTTAGVSSPGNSTANRTTNAAGTPVTGGGNSGTNALNAPTATLSNALPTATVVPATPLTPTKTMAKVVKTDGKGANMRSDTHINGTNEKSNVVAKVLEGETVEITGAFKNSEGITWWPVTYKGQSGWIASDYLQKL